MPWPSKIAIDFGGGAGAGDGDNIYSAFQQVQTKFNAIVDTGLASPAATIAGTDTTQPVHSAGVAAAIYDRFRDGGALYAAHHGVYPLTDSRYNETSCWDNFIALIAESAAVKKPIILGAGQYYLAEEIVIPFRTSIVAAGKLQTQLLCAAASPSATAFMKFDIADADKTLEPPLFAGFDVNFNYPVQPAGLIGAEIVEPAFVVGSGYPRAPMFFGVGLSYAKGTGLKIGANRNQLFADDMSMWGGQADGIVASGSDHHIRNTDIGGHYSGAGIRLVGGGYFRLHDSWVYYNKNNLHREAGAVSLSAIGTDFDGATETAMILEGAASNSNYFVSLIDCLFGKSSSSADGTFPDIQVKGPVPLAIVAPRHFRQVGVSRTKYFLEFTDRFGDQPTKAYLYAPNVDRTQATWATAFANRPDLVAGDRPDAFAPRQAAAWSSDSSATVASATNSGAPALTVVGALMAIGTSAGTGAMELRRAEYRQSSPSTSAVAGWWLAGSGGWRIGNASSATRGGFEFTCTFGMSSGATNATHRLFLGMSAATIAPTDAAPSSEVNCLGVGWDSGDTNISVIHNDASGAATKIDLGTDFPRPSADWTDAYDVEFLATPGATQVVTYRVRNRITDKVARGKITTNLPATTVVLYPRAFMGAGGTSSSVGIGLASLRIANLW